MRPSNEWKLPLILTVVLLGTCLPLSGFAAPSLPWHLVAQYPHSTHAFTEGLAICGGKLVESDGLYGHSKLQVRDLRTGKVLKQRRLSNAVFGEGVTCAGGRIIQLTWKAGLIFTYNAMLQPLHQYAYHEQGWGLAFDGKRLIASDGTAVLHLLNPRTLAVTGQISVHDGGQPVTQLNELEWAKGAVWANVWHRNRVTRIDVKTGAVTGWLNLSPLVIRAARSPEWRPGPENVLNGIAWDPATGHFFVTGKNWPLMFEIALGARSN